MVLLQNATAGMNAILQADGLLVPGDRVFMLDTGYGSVKRLATEVCARTGAKLDIAHLPLPLPANHDDAVESIVDCAKRHIQPGTKVVVFDEITSNTAINMPISELAAAARERAGNECKVVVDGAHGLLARPLNLPMSGADYYVTNCHKWFSSPKGAAILWANRNCAAEQPRNPMAPLIISHGYGQGTWSGFAWDGCRDYSAALSLPVVANFWNALGIEASRKYMDRLLITATDILKDAWAPVGRNKGTGGALIAPLTMHGPMALVALPEFLDRPANSTDAKIVQDALHHEHKVECPIKCIEGRLYVRISAHVYNDPADYTALADAVVAIVTNR